MTGPLALPGAYEVTIAVGGESQTPRFEIIKDPRHPYTKGLLEANLHDADPSETLISIPGSPPPLDVKPDHCSFAHHSDTPLKPNNDWIDLSLFIRVFENNEIPRFKI